MRRTGCCFILLLWMLLLMMPPGRAGADSAPLVAVGPTLQPRGETRVRMESERIHIRVSRAVAEQYPFGLDAAVEVRFHFVPEADESIEAGFPLHVMDAETRMYGELVRDFEVLVGEKPLPFRQETVTWERTQMPWAVWKLEFQKGRPLDLTVRYRLRVYPYGKSASADLWLGYILRTGAFWAGPIGRAEATISLDRPILREDVRPERTTPGWTLQDGTLRWDWRDLEPDFDLHLFLANSYWADLPAEIEGMLPLKSRDDLLRAMKATENLLHGGNRDQAWLPVRGGELSGRAAERFLPRLVEAARAELASHPTDWELRQGYMRLLGLSAVREDEQQSFKLVLLSGERLRLYLEEAVQYRRDGGPVDWRIPGGEEVYIMAERAYALSSDAALRKAAADGVVYFMPASFGTEEEARRWVEKWFGSRPDGAGPELLPAVLKRVEPAQTAESPESPAPVRLVIHPIFARPPYFWPLVAALVLAPAVIIAACMLIIRAIRRRQEVRSRDH